MASDMFTPIVVPDGQYPPLFTITPTDQAGTVVIVTAVCLITAFVSILMRAYVMMQLGTFRLRWDDWTVIVAFLLAIIQTSLVQREAVAGLGRTLSDLTSDEIRQIQHLQFSDQIFYILSVWTSKISACMFYYRLSPKSADRRMATGAIALIGITGIVGMLILCCVCDISQPWNYFDSEKVTCTAPYSRWAGVSAMDILSEVVLACIATKMLWPLQMRVSRKLAAGFVFYQRLVIIAPIITQLHYLSAVYHGDDPTFAATYSTICKEVVIAFAVFATNIPCFRPFLLTTATHYGAPTKGTTSGFGHYATGGASMELSNLSNSKHSHVSTQENTTDAPPKKTAELPTWTGTRYMAAATGSVRQRQDATSVGSNDSREMIIRKDIDYHVQYYDREIGPSDRDGSSE